MSPYIRFRYAWHVWLVNMHSLLKQTAYSIEGSRGGGVEKQFGRIFFRTPAPPPGLPPEKKDGTPWRNFFRQEGFLYCVLLELACPLRFATL